MSDEKYQWTTEYDEVKTGEEEEKSDPDAMLEKPDDDPLNAMDPEELAELTAKIEARRKARRKQKLRRRRLAVMGVILIFAALFTMCGREIFRLKAENYALQKQQEELKAERDRLAEELKKVGEKEYIKNQARRQLRLLDPGEIMFVFQDEDEAEADKGQDDKS